MLKESKNRKFLTGNDLKVEYQPVADLAPYSRNARTHTKKHIRQIAESIKTFGFTNPILVDQDSMVIAGHGRLEAAKHIGLTDVPVIQLTDLNEEQVRAYILADNRLAELAGWDEEIVATELQYLLEMDLDFEIGVIGFETAEIDLMIERVSPTNDPNDELPETEPDKPPVSRPGDLWLLGQHRLLCADALEKASYVRVMDSDQARLVFTDPPYNVPIQGHVGGSGQIQHAEFAMAAGELSEAEFTQFLTSALSHHSDHCFDGALLYICMDWRHQWELQSASRNLGFNQLNLCVWNKDNGGMGSMYRSKHELVSVFKKGDEPHINNIELGRFGRYRTNVWDYPGVNTFREGRLEELQLHPTVKPVGLIKDALLDASDRNDIILDGFGGAGTTLLAAEQCQRRARLIELEPCYVDTTIRRWEAYTGQQAIHEESGKTFTEIAYLEVNDGEE